jgi:predicted transcriptional regulator
MKQKENKSLFLKQFGDTPQLRVMDFLIDNQFFDFPMTEIARGSNVSYNSLKLFFNNLIENNIIFKTRRIGKSDYFKLNINNLFVKSMIKIDWILTKRNLFGTGEKKEAVSIKS